MVLLQPREQHLPVGLRTVGGGRDHGYQLYEAVLPQEQRYGVASEEHHVR